MEGMPKRRKISEYDHQCGFIKCNGCEDKGFNACHDSFLAWLLGEVGVEEIVEMLTKGITPKDFEKADNDAIKALAQAFHKEFVIMRRGSE